MTKQEFMWVLPSSKLMESLHRAFRGDDPQDIILDLWDERDRDNVEINISRHEEAK